MIDIEITHKAKAVITALIRTKAAQKSKAQ